MVTRMDAGSSTAETDGVEGRIFGTASGKGGKKGLGHHVRGARSDRRVEMDGHHNGASRIDPVKPTDMGRIHAVFSVG